MKCTEIHIRDPFVLYENGIYYMYGTRGADFGQGTAGFDVYTSADLVNWSAPTECFDSARYGMNQKVNWAPEVHKYNGAYYMFATFTRENGLKGTHILRADGPLGPFTPHSNGPVTPADWESLDGTLYVDEEGIPFVVFCHEHVQITDGTICYTRLSEDLKTTVGEPTVLFAASSCPYINPYKYRTNWVTDGPFFYRTERGELLMIWSSFIGLNYAELCVRFQDGKLGTAFEHLPPLIDNDGGHGMIFKAQDKLYFTFHTPNTAGAEHPAFVEITDNGTTLSIK